jgi:riboflavin synthase alpha subunit
MFTGLIEGVGRVASADTAGEGGRIRITSPLAAELRPGDSIAVNGVCLTAAAVQDGTFDADLSPETRRVTTLGSAAPGRRLNLERPLRADARIGGHFVLGHVDGVGRVVSVTPQGDCLWLELDGPSALAPCLISKGSIAVDGVSLTIAALSGDRISIQLVPFTIAHTALGDLRPGDAVNLEGDVLGKYVVRLLAQRGELGVAIARGEESPV